MPGSENSTTAHSPIEPLEETTPLGTNKVNEDKIIWWKLDLLKSNFYYLV